MELLKSLAGLDIKHVPYRSGNRAVNDLIDGHLDVFVGSLPQMIEPVRAGSATAMAVTSPHRSATVPDLTLAESGAHGCDLEQWWGIAGPAGTPRPIVDKLNAELTRIMATPEVRLFMAREGAESTPSTPEQFGAHLSAELQRWSDLAARAGVKVPD